MGLEKDEVLPIIKRGIQHGELPPGTAHEYKHNKEFKEKVHRDIGKAKKKRGPVNGKHNADLPEDQVLDIVKKGLPKGLQQEPDNPLENEDYYWDDTRGWVPKHGPTFLGWPLPLGPWYSPIGSPIGFPLSDPILVPL